PPGWRGRADRGSAHPCRSNGEPKNDAASPGPGSGGEQETRANAKSRPATTRGRPAPALPRSDRLVAPAPSCRRRKMRLSVKGKNLEVSDSIRRYAEEKLGKLNPQLHELTQVELELCVEKNPSIAENQVAEATVWTKGPTLRAREASTDMKVSIDQLTDKLMRQVEHYRAKRRRRHARNDGIPSGGPMSIEEDVGPQIVKSKQFTVKPMSAEEAALQLELVGHDFFVFRSDESGEVNVIYRRRDGGYGLIEPQS